MTFLEINYLSNCLINIFLSYNLIALSKMQFKSQKEKEQRNVNWLILPTIKML